MRGKYFPPFSSGVLETISPQTQPYHGIAFGESSGRFHKVLQGQEIFPSSRPSFDGTLINRRPENTFIPYLNPNWPPRTLPLPAQISSPSSVLMFQQAGAVPARGSSSFSDFLGVPMEQARAVTPPSDSESTPSGDCRLFGFSLTSEATSPAAGSCTKVNALYDLCAAAAPFSRSPCFYSLLR